MYPNTKKILENIKAKCPSFPVLQAAQLESIRKNLRSIPLSLRSQEEQHEEQFISYLLKGINTHGEQINLYALLDEQELDENPLINSIAVDLYLVQLEEIFQYEKKPLFLIKNLVVPTPISFVATLRYLVRRNLSVEDILASGLLHQYVLIYQDDVQAVYQFLHKQYPEELHELYTTANQISADIPHYSWYTLTGETKETSKSINVELNPYFTDTLENFEKLYSSAKDNLITLLLRFDLRSKELDQYFTRLKNQELKDFVQRNPASIKKLRERIRDDQYLALINDPPSELSWKLIHAYFSHVSRRRPIIGMSEDEYELFKRNNQFDLEYIIKTYPIQETDIIEVHELSRKALFRPYQDYIYQEIFKHLVNHPELCDEELEEDLKTHPSIKSWCKKTDQELTEKLYKLIKSSPQPLDSDQLIKINDYYQKYSATIQLFKRLGEIECYFPHNTHALHADIIRERWALERETILTQIAVILAPNYAYSSYSESEKQQAKYRILFECLLRQNDPDFSQCILSILTGFSRNNLDKISSLNELIDRALSAENPAALVFIFNQYEKQDYKIMTRLRNEGCLADFLKRIIEKPDFLATMLKARSIYNIFNQLSDHVDSILLNNPAGLKVLFNSLEFSNKEKLKQFSSHFIKKISLEKQDNVDLLEIIFNHLSEQEISKFLLESFQCRPRCFHYILTHSPKEKFSETLLCFIKQPKDSEENTNLHDAALYAESLENIFQYGIGILPLNNQLNLLKTPNKEGYTPLHFAAIFGASSLGIMLNNIPVDKRFSALTEWKTNEGDAVIHKAFRLDSLKEILEAIPDEEQRLKILLTCNAHGRTILLYHAKINPDCLNLILKYFQDKHRILELMNIQELNQPIESALCIEKPTAIPFNLSLLDINVWLKKNNNIEKLSNHENIPNLERAIEILSYEENGKNEEYDDPRAMLTQHHTASYFSDPRPRWQYLGDGDWSELNPSKFLSTNVFSNSGGQNFLDLLLVESNPLQKACHLNKCRKIIKLSCIKSHYIKNFELFNMLQELSLDDSKFTIIEYLYHQGLLQGEQGFTYRDIILTCPHPEIVINCLYILTWAERRESPADKPHALLNAILKCRFLSKVTPFIIEILTLHFVTEENAIKLLESRDHETLYRQLRPDYTRSLKPGELPREAIVFGVHGNLSGKNSSMINDVKKQINIILDQMSKQESPEAKGFVASAKRPYDALEVGIEEDSKYPKR